MYEGPGLVVLLGVEEDVGKRAFLDASRPYNAAVRALAEVLCRQGKGEERIRPDEQLCQPDRAAEEMGAVGSPFFFASPPRGCLN